MCVRFIFKHPVALLANVLVLLAEKPFSRVATGGHALRIHRQMLECAHCFFASNLFFVIQTENPRI
jgi:hypothetical protein